MQLPLVLRAILRCAPPSLRPEMISVMEEFLEHESPTVQTRIREYASLSLAIVGMRWRRSSSVAIGLVAAVILVAGASIQLSRAMAEPSHSASSIVSQDSASNGRAVALASKIQQIMESQEPASFAGIAISPSNAVEVFVKSGSLQTVRSAISESIPESTARVNLHGVQRSLVELESLQSETQNKLRTLNQKRVAISSTWLDIQSNQVIIGFQTDSLDVLGLPPELTADPAIRITRANSVAAY